MTEYTSYIAGSKTVKFLSGFPSVKTHCVSWVTAVDPGIQEIRELLYRNTEVILTL